MIERYVFHKLEEAENKVLIKGILNAKREPLTEEFRQGGLIGWLSLRDKNKWGEGKILS